LPLPIAIGTKSLSAVRHVKIDNFIDIIFRVREKIDENVKKCTTVSNMFKIL
jgi:hypothetical protein